MIGLCIAGVVFYLATGWSFVVLVALDEPTALKARIDRAIMCLWPLFVIGASFAWLGWSVTRLRERVRKGGAR